jgi:tetratricopeptide (TPR) repeat protein
LDDIVAAMQQVAKERPDYALVPAAIGRAYSLAGQQPQALTYFEQALALGDRSPQVAQQLADIYMTNKNYDQALPLYEYVVQQAPNVQTSSALAFIYAQQGRLPEAIEQNQLVLQQLPGDYDSLKNLALLYRQTGQLQESLSSAQQAREVAPEADRASWEPFIADLETQLADAG